MAEYEGLLVGLRVASVLGIFYLVIRRDSQLVVRKFKKEYLATKQTMVAYFAEERFSKIDFKYIHQKDNYVSDAFDRQAST